MYCVLEALQNTL